jgi:hypothetical protein
VIKERRGEEGRWERKHGWKEGGEGKKEGRKEGKVKEDKCWKEDNGP